MKKINLLFTALLLMCYVGTAKAQHFEIDGIFYNITDSNSKTVEVTYKGSSYDSYLNEYTGCVVIPERVTYNGTTYSVTSIGYGAFSYCSGLKEVHITDLDAWKNISFGDDFANPFYNNNAKLYLNGVEVTDY